MMEPEPPDRVDPSILRRRAEALLPDTSGAGPMHTVYRPGIISLFADHTLYFPGFGLMIPMPYGVAIALRETENPAQDLYFAPDVDAVFAEHVTRAWHMLPKENRSNSLEIGILNVLPKCLRDEAIVATVAALIHLLAVSDGETWPMKEMVPRIRQVVKTVTGRPLPPAYALAAAAGQREDLILLDTETLEHLPVALSDRAELAWGLLACATQETASSDYETRKANVETMMTQLRAAGFVALHSLRDLAHRDLVAAQECLPASFQGTLRHLVTENARVQRLLAALHQQDWQVAGASLFMGNQSLHKDWGHSDPFADLIQALRGIDGLYGGKRVGRFGEHLLMVGQPTAVGQFLARGQAHLEATGQTTTPLFL